MVDQAKSHESERAEEVYLRSELNPIEVSFTSVGPRKPIKVTEL